MAGVKKKALNGFKKVQVTMKGKIAQAFEGYCNDRSEYEAVIARDAIYEYLKKRGLI